LVRIPSLDPVITPL